MMKIDTKIPEHQSTYCQLRDMILLGRFAPGQSLTIMGLAKILNVGMTPAREALRRLTTEHALSSLKNRRVIVPELTPGDIDDIYFLRLQVEPELARKAAKNIDKQCLKDLFAIDLEIDTALEDGNVEAYLELNNRFHFKIYEQARSLVLLHVARMLWLQVGPSLRIVSGRFGTANLPDKHIELLNAFRNRDEEAASKAMKEDLQQSLWLILPPTSV